MKQLKNLQRLSKIFMHYKIKNRILPYLPVRAWLEPTNRCNLKCRLCPNSTDTTSERGNMDYDLFKSIVDQITGSIHDVNLSHRGESLFHPDIYKMIRYCGDRLIKTRVHSNGTQLDEDKSRELIESGLDLLSFSFDGFDKESYEQTRVNAKFEETLDKIVNFLRLKQKLSSSKPFTIIQVIMDTNFPQTQKHRNEFMKHFENLPLDRLYIKEAHNWGGNMELDCVDTSNIRKGRFSMCTFPWYAVTILWDGKVVPCPQDWFAEMTMGDLNKTDLKTIWNEQPVFDLRTRMVNRDLKGILCDTCDRPWRKQFMGIPVENAKTFLKEHVLGYKSLSTS